MKYYIITLVLILAFACHEDIERNQEGSSAFFDVSEYVDAYLTDQTSGLTVDKTVIVDGKEEQKQLEAYNMNLDLEGLDALDLNKPALWDRYQVDSLYDEGELRTIKFTPLDDQESVKLLTLSFTSHQLSKLEGLRRDKTLLADVETHYRWIPNQEYRILRKEDRMLGSSSQREVRIVVR